jgi:glycosyltransferase involved in cell wall biosynthesis
MYAPLVSVGIPFLNCEKCLLDSIRSIFAQTFEDWELILVDDGSTDGSLKLAQSIDDPRVRLLPPDGKNKKLAARLNQIVQAARGEFIARMDADDMSHPERFAGQLEFLKNHPHVDVVGASSHILGAHRQPAQKSIVPESHEQIFIQKFQGVSIIHPTITARSPWFLRFPYAHNFVRCEDYELWLRSCNRSVFANIQEPLYFQDVFSYFSLAKYIRSSLNGAKVIKAHYPEELDKFNYISYAARRYRLIAVYTVYAMLGLANLRVRRRYRLLDPQEIVEANKALDTIKKTDVPMRNTKMMSS